MDLAENRFGKTWKHFLEALKVDYFLIAKSITLSDHTGNVENIPFTLHLFFETLYSSAIAGEGALLHLVFN